MLRRHFGIMKAAARREQERTLDVREPAPHGDFPRFDLAPLGDMAGSGNLAMLTLGIGIIMVFGAVIISVVIWLLMLVF